MYRRRNMEQLLEQPPLKRELHSLNHLCVKAVYRRLRHISRCHNLGERMVTNGLKPQDIEVLSYLKCIPKIFLRLFIHSLIDHLSDGNPLDLFPLLVVDMIESLSLPVHGDSYIDMFNFLKDYGSKIKSLRLYAPETASSPDKTIGNIIWNLPALTKLELVCTEPLAKYCTHLLNIADVNTVPNLKTLRLLEISNSLQNKALRVFANVTCNFLARNPGLNSFAFESPFQIINLLKQRKIVLMEITKLELPLLLLTKNIIEDISITFPNLIKFAVDAKKGNTRHLRSILDLKKLDFRGKYDRNSHDFDYISALESPCAKIDSPDRFRLMEYDFVGRILSLDTAEITPDYTGSDLREYFRSICDFEIDFADEVYDDRNYEIYCEDFLHQEMPRPALIKHIQYHSVSFRVMVGGYLSSPNPHLTSLHLDGFHGVDLQIIDRNCPQLKSLKLHCCSIVNTPSFTYNSDHPFLNLEKFKYTTSDPIKKFYKRDVLSKHLSYPYQPYKEDFLYILKSATKIRQISICPSIRFDDYVIRSLIFTNQFPNLETIYLGFSGVTSTGLIDLLKCYTPIWRKVHIEIPAKMASIEIKLIRAAPHCSDLEFIIDY